MKVAKTISEFLSARSELSTSVGFAPTMGSLHRGHLALVRQARAENTSVVVSIFVNPAQFGPHEDFAEYPRDLDRDVGVLADEGVDLVFAPSTDELYTTGHDTWVEVKGISERLEGFGRVTSAAWQPWLPSCSTSFAHSGPTSDRRMRSRRS
jgi:pantoate--beta-alanine ligase